MSEKIRKFRIYASTNTVGSEDYQEIEVDGEELEGIDPENIDDYIRENCGGKETFWELVETWIEETS